MRAQSHALCRLALAGWTAIAAGSFGAAEETSPPETVRVEGQAPSRPVDLAASCTVIRPEDYAGRITSLAELLSEAAGVHVRSLGGLDAYATVSIRGSSSEQVNVYVDGVLLNSALGGGVDLSSLSLAQIESIEIYRGVVPAWLEGSGIGGAISIRTRRNAAGQPAAEGSLSFGSYATALADARVSWDAVGPRDALDGSIAFSGRSTRGDFRFFDNNGTREEGSDDGWRTRTNNGSWFADVTGRMGVALSSGGRLEAEAGVTRRRQGVPGIDVLQSESARSQMERAVARVGWLDDAMAGGAWHGEAGLFYSRTRQAFHDRAGDITGGRSTDAHDILTAAGPSALLRRRAGTGPLRHQLTLQATARRETAAQTDDVLPEPDRGDGERLTCEAAAEDEVHMAGGRLALIPSVRWLSSSSRFEGVEGTPRPGTQRSGETRWTGRLGAAWRPRPAWLLRANAGSFFRLPSLMEIFGNQGAIRPSTGLRPEQGWNTDAGISWEKAGAGSLRRLSVDATVFQTRADDLIQLVQTSQSQVTARNTGQARITGTEWSFAAALRGGLGGSVNYTRQVAEDRSAGRFTRGSDLPGRPRHELSARAQIDRRWGSPSWEMTWIGPYFVDAAAAVLDATGAEGERIPGRYLHTLGFTAPAGRRIDWTIEVDNVGNVRTVDLVRYPLPGRVVQLRVRMSLP